MARFVYIGLERVNQVLRFDFSKGFTRARGEVVPLPPAASKLPYNKGLEALVFVPKGMPLAGTLIAISERGLDANGNLIGFLVGGPIAGAVQRPPHRQIRYQRRRAAGLGRSADAGAEIFLALRHRHPHPAHRARRRWRRAPWSTVPRSSRPISAMRSTTWKASTPIVTPEGDTVLTMVSDDNFSLIQRTLLLQFTLVA